MNSLQILVERALTVAVTTIKDNSGEFIYVIITPNITGEWLALLLYIWKVMGSNLSP
jgi:hypothetical protein